jgi:hypothetical protein
LSAQSSARVKRAPGPALVLLATLAALCAPASAGQNYQTEVVLEGGSPQSEGSNFIDLYGTVSAEGPSKCDRDRFIGVFVADSGPDLKLGSTRSDSGGFWSLTKDGSEIQPGEYYARAPKLRLANGSVCLADKSDFFLIF